MGVWSFYFFAKLYLFIGGYIGFHWVENLLFALFLLIPLPRNQRVLRWLRSALALPIALILLYHDSWLPGFDRVLTQTATLESFSPDYLLELLGRFIKPLVVGGLALCFIVYLLLGSRLRMSSFALLGIVAVPLVQNVQAYLPHNNPLEASLTSNSGAPAAALVGEAGLNATLASFFSTEAQRKVSFTATPGLSTLPFDIIVLHVCSLSWDDLNFVDLRSHPLFSQFDLLFDNFNSATAYSGPSAIRLLRGNCGQTPHLALYKPTSPDCYLFKSLEDAGFEPQILLNHDGRFDHFLETLREHGLQRAREMDNRQAPVAQRSFDGTPIYDDYSLLAAWWQNRLSSKPAPAALYYNTISLHDGNRSADGRNVSSLDNYRPRAERLFSDISRFLTLLAASDRPAIVVFVPEHGAGLRGDKMQIAGMREIPSAAVTHVPVGIKLVGLKMPPAAVHRVSQTVSYLGLTHVLAGLTRMNPFNTPVMDYGDLLVDLPVSNWVSQNEAALLMRQKDRYYVKTQENAWIDFIP